MRASPRAGLWSGLRIAAVLAGASGLIGCGPSVAERRLDSGGAAEAVRWSDERLTIVVLPYTPRMEVDTFGVDLGEAQQIAIELRFETAKATDSVLLRRHDIVLVLENGMRRYPLDATKVYEAQRVEKTGAIVMFGLTGAAVANATDDKRQSLFDQAALGDVRLDRETTRVGGFLFFDVSGTEGSRADALLLEYEDGDGQTHSAKIDL